MRQKKNSGSVPQENSSGSVPQEKESGALPAAAKVHEALDRVLGEDPGPEPTGNPPRTYVEAPAELRAEMDQAMEATRTMFSDVDRFIILGQIRNAIGALDLRIKREPTDRDSWIKLMAIYRDEGMNGGFDRTYAAFREQFGTSTDS